MSKTIMTLHDEQAGMVMRTANQQVAARSSGLVLGGGGGWTLAEQQQEEEEAASGWARSEAAGISITGMTATVLLLW